LVLVQGLFSVSVFGDIWFYHAHSARLVIPLFCFFVLWMGDEYSRSIGDSPQRRLD
jgi:hypothetical protein